MIDKYENLEGLKEEINNFIKLVDIEVNQNDIIYVTKKLVFFKCIKMSLEEQYYCDCLISDSLQMLNLLHQNSKRLFYMVYRSLIENSIRFCLGIHRGDNTGVNELFRGFQCLYDENEIEKDLYAFVKGQYTIGCNFTHSNISAKLNLFEYYTDTINADKPTKDDMERLFNVEKRYLQVLLELTMIKKTDLIDMAFYRESQKLRFLLSKSEYGKYRSYLEKAEFG